MSTLFTILKIIFSFISEIFLDSAEISDVSSPKFKITSWLLVFLLALSITCNVYLTMELYETGVYITKCKKGGVTP